MLAHCVRETSNMRRIEVPFLANHIFWRRHIGRAYRTETTIALFVHLYVNHLPEKGKHIKAAASNTSKILMASIKSPYQILGRL